MPSKQQHRGTVPIADSGFLATCTGPPGIHPPPEAADPELEFGLSGTGLGRTGLKAPGPGLWPGMEQGARAAPP